MSDLSNNAIITASQMQQNCLTGSLIETLNIKYSDLHKKWWLILGDGENFPESPRLCCELQ